MTTLGTGFLVTNKIKHLIVDFKPITRRICILRMRESIFNCSIVNGYAPTEIYDDEEKDGVFMP